MRFCTPRSRMLPSVIGGPCSVLGVQMLFSQAKMFGPLGFFDSALALACRRCVPHEWFIPQERQPSRLRPAQELANRFCHEDAEPAQELRTISEKGGSKCP